MHKLLIAAAIAVAALTGSAVLAAQPTPVPNAKPDFSSMSFLLGTWHCVQTVPNRPGKRTETDTYTMAYDGWQMQDHSVAPPFDRYRTRTIVGDTFTTWDPMLKIWVVQNVDNFGGYGLSSSKGWKGNKMTWTSTGLDGTMFRADITKVSDTRYTTASWGNSTKGGAMVSQGTGTCTKS